MAIVYTTDLTDKQIKKCMANAMFIDGISMVVLGSLLRLQVDLVLILKTHKDNETNEQKRASGAA